MDVLDRSFRVLRTLIGFGGLLGLAVGLVILFWGDVIISAATRMLAPTCPLYWRTMGLLAASLGGLQVVPSQDQRRYLAIPIAAHLVRLLIPILTYAQVLDIPSMVGMLIVSTVFDLFLAVATVVLLFQTGLLTRSQP